MAMPSEDQARQAFARAVREAPQAVIDEVGIDSHSEFAQDWTVFKIKMSNELIEKMTGDQPPVLGYVSLGPMLPAADDDFT